MSCRSARGTPQRTEKPPVRRMSFITAASTTGTASRMAR